MPIIKLNSQLNENYIFYLRMVAGFVWFGTVLRRLFTPNFSNFEQRITDMASGTTIFPQGFMNIAVANWYIIFLIIIFFETISSFSLLTGTFSRGGALIATITGFGIGMAGIGLGIIELLVPWSVAIVTLFLFLFTHPGVYRGVDSRLKEKNLPKIIKIFI